MIRNAFKMKLKPGNVAEYKKRHDALWPELARELRAAGISDYSIFLDEETLTLFAVQKLADGHTAAALPGRPSCASGGITWPRSWKANPAQREQPWVQVPQNISPSSRVLRSREREKVVTQRETG